MNYSVYIIISKLDTSKCYIGVTNGNTKNYYGSGKFISRVLKKYGKHNFSKNILGTFDSPEEAHFWEGFYIKEYKTEVKYGGYNISPTGGTRYNGKHSDESIKKFSGIKNPMYNKNYFDVWIEKYGIEEAEKLQKERSEKLSKASKGNSRSKGCEHSEESDKRRSETLKGKEPWNKGLTKETDLRVKESSEAQGRSRKGKKRKPFSEEWKQNMGKAQKKRYADRKIGDVWRDGTTLKVAV